MSQLKLDYPRGEIIAKKYEIVDHLHTGPLGYLYRAKHLKTGKYMRLLLLNPDHAGREHKEAVINAYKTARSLMHPNLLRVEELGEHAGVAFIAMQDFDGKPLSELIRSYKAEGKRFELREAAQIITQTLGTLAHLHEHGLYFRALRPEYILVNIKRTGPRGANMVCQIRLIGAVFWDLIPPGVIAEEEFSLGEAHYLAPELKGFEPMAGPRADVYSAGVIFYELLVGTAPMGTFQLPRTRRPDLPAHIDSVVELALANAPEDRYPSVTDFSQDIQRTFQLGTAEEETEVKSGIHPLIYVLGAIVVGLVVFSLFGNDVDPLAEKINQDNLVRNEMITYYTDLRNSPKNAQYDEVRSHFKGKMFLIPEGPFLQGRLNQEEVKNEPLAKKVELPAYLIDSFEFPNQRNKQPLASVTQSEAAAKCEEVGKRLCSADELEKACKGANSMIYGYGDTYDPEYCIEKADDDTTFFPSGSFGDCRSSWGVLDLAGNYSEWTSTEDSPGRFTVKGGKGKGTDPEGHSRCGYSKQLPGGLAESYVSFRCCLSLDDAKAQLTKADTESE